jgi:glutathione peroxidase
MIKSILIIITLFSSSLIFSFFKKKGTPSSSIHSFKVNAIDGQAFDLSSLKGKKILVVNTASKCGFTPQFEALQALYEKYKDKNFIIIGFPCNQFGNQDPGTGDEIKAFCTKNYGVTFPMMEKIDVKGEHAAEIYKWLTSGEKNGVESSSVKWNFQKYMIDENGYLVDHVPSYKKPNCSKIVNWIEGK